MQVDSRAAAMLAAHNLNEHLTIVINGAAVGREMLESGDPLRVTLREIETAGWLCAAQAKELLLFGAGKKANT